MLKSYLSKSKAVTIFFSGQAKYKISFGIGTSLGKKTNEYDQ